ncbi:hypothetical protein XELAEV_18018401mg [Xenopus laevis]|uniref:Uncharacterized protein n=1 Tax=Xenopus laevis TaxID=8355 RepID=A0A974DDJ5_XENLA|nr:hypothetical protein XELAEV_18018401mg [Xenopus laevis]
MHQNIFLTSSAVGWVNDGMFNHICYITGSPATAAFRDGGHCTFPWRKSLKCTNASLLLLGKSHPSLVHKICFNCKKSKILIKQII